MRPSLCRSTLALCLFVTLAATHAAAQNRRNKKYEEPKPQVLPLPRELPMVLPAETAGLTFYASPLLKTGGLAAQIRTALNNLLHDTHGSTVIKVRAFVAGVGDARRVQTAISELFSSHKLPLPVVTILQVGGLGEETAQVALEAVLSTNQQLNPNGLAFLPGQHGRSVLDAVGGLQKSLLAIGLSSDDVASATCFAAQIEPGARTELQTAFPRAAVTAVQAQRDPLQSGSMCQAVARLRAKEGDSSREIRADSGAILVHSSRLVFTGLQLSFGSYLDDAKEAFQRLQRLAASVDGGGSPVEVNSFALDLTAGSAIRKSTAVPSATFSSQTVEGLPSMDASAGIEAVLAPGGPGDSLLPH